jgi:hypothetical protein
MSKQHEVNKSAHTPQMQTRQLSGFAGLNHNLLPELDTAPYKQAGTWPGKNFMLLGNSFNLEAKLSSNCVTATKRTASLAIMFEQARETRRCIYLADALSNQSFLETLSRFETDWLRRMPADTVIGPAYNIKNELIGEAFAVWRSIDVIRQFKTEKVLVGAR